MIPIKLELHNFMSYQNPQPLDFNLFSLACISGENGVGKSTLLEAISWALWGKTRAGSDDNLIHANQNICWVDFTFAIEDKIFRVTRKRSRKGRGSSELYFAQITENFQKSLTRDSIKDTQKEITKTLRMPYEIFTNSAYLRQGRADEFTLKTPAERKQILSEILGLNEYEKLAQNCNLKVRELENENQAIQIQITDTKTQLQEKTEIVRQLKKVTKNLTLQQKNLQKLEEKLSALQKIKNQLDLINQNIKNIRQRMQEIVKEVNDFKKEKEINLENIALVEKALKESQKISQKIQRLEKLEKQDQALAKKLDKLVLLREKMSLAEKKFNNARHAQQVQVEKINAQIEHEKKQTNLKIKRLKSFAQCPTCLRKINHQEKQKLINLIRKQLIDKEKVAQQKINQILQQKISDEELKKLDQKCRALSYNQQLHNKIRREIEALQTIRQEKEKLTEYKTQIVQLSENNLKIDQKIKELKEIFVKLKKQGIELNEKRNQIEPKVQKLSQVENQVLMLRNECLNLQSEFSRLDERLKFLESLEKNIVQKENRLKKISEEIAIFDQLSEAFGKKGIQAMVIESAIPEIEDEANNLLESLTNGRMRLNLVTQRVKKVDQQISETLDITISDNLGTRKYEMFSGGEAFRINFALRIALSKLLSHRAGAKLQFLAIDEGFGTQDAQGRMALVEAINSIKSDFEKIIIITHLQELKDAFPARIDVTKDEKGSHLEVNV